MKGSVHLHYTYFVYAYKFSHPLGMDNVFLKQEKFH